MLRTGALTTESRLDNAIFSYGKRDERPPGELGQVYTLRYEMSSVTTGETSFVSQDLYPFAESGPVTYLPRQSVQIDEVELQMASGWTPVPARAVERLHALGLPQDTSRFDPLGRTGLLPWAWLLASGSLGLLIVNRFRRPARMHSARPTV